MRRVLFLVVGALGALTLTLAAQAQTSTFEPDVGIVRDPEQ